MAFEAQFRELEEASTFLFIEKRKPDNADNNTKFHNEGGIYGSKNKIVQANKQEK
jgi:hypothetical protein